MPGQHAKYGGAASKASLSNRLLVYGSCLNTTQGPCFLPDFFKFEKIFLFVTYRKTNINVSLYFTNKKN